MGKTGEQAQRPEFAGTPLRDVPVPAADLLRDDDFGTSILAEYNERTRRDFGDHPFLKVLKTSGGVVHGSNPFAVCLVDMIVRPRVRVATLVDLQAILDSKGKVASTVPLRGGYKDAALALRSVRQPNAYLAEHLAEQIGAKFQWPAVVLLSGLALVKDDNSPCGLGFQATDQTSAFHAPVLSEKSGHFSNQLVDRATGLPARVEGTGRYFYSIEGGLSRVYMGRGSSIDTIWDELGNSQADGRIVLVDNTVPSRKLGPYTAKLDEATDLLAT
jgi:hypothetical protein